jgi:hypothetical protein
MHKIFKIKSFEIVAPYTLSLVFDDGAKKIINFKNILKGQLLKPLNNLDIFNQVRLDEEIKTIVWPNGADFDPETLHNWDNYKNEFEAMTNKWD